MPREPAMYKDEVMQASFGLMFVLLLALGLIIGIGATVAVVVMLATGKKERSKL